MICQLLEKKGDGRSGDAKTYDYFRRNNSLTTFLENSIVGNAGLTKWADHQKERLPRMNDGGRVGSSGRMTSGKDSNDGNVDAEWAKDGGESSKKKARLEADKLEILALAVRILS